MAENIIEQLLHSRYLGRVGLAKASLPERVIFREPGFKNIGRIILVDPCLAAPAIARMNANSLSEKLLNSWIKRMARGQSKIAKSQLRCFETPC
jgi:hypothetical protein